MIDVRDIWKAKINIDPYIHRTPVCTSAQIDRIAETKVVFKCENYQKTGSFKARGAFSFITNMTEEEKRNGVVCFSSGNHAQAVSYAASVFGLSSWIVMPEYTAGIKIDSCREYGGNLVIQGQGPEAYEVSQRLRREMNLSYIDPSDDPYVQAGQGTVGLEILEDCPDADTVFIPVGGGGLLAGIAVAVKSLSPQARVIGVEPENMNCMETALKHPEKLPIQRIPSIADALGGLEPARSALLTARKYVDDVITVSEEEIAYAAGLVISRMKVYAEPSAAVSLAGLLSGKVRPGRKNVCVLSGGNAALEGYSAWKKETQWQTF